MVRAEKIRILTHFIKCRNPDSGLRNCFNLVQIFIFANIVNFYCVISPHYTIALAGIHEGQHNQSRPISRPVLARAKDPVMRKQLTSSAAALSITFVLAACGGGENTRKTSSIASEGASAPTSISLAVSSALLPSEAARLAKQASFGPTQELVDEIVASGAAEDWINGQFSYNSSTYADISAKTVPGNYCGVLTGADLNNCYRNNFSAVPVQMRFYSNAVSNKDQLRQRVAFALSQIIVASELDVHNTSGLAAFNQILLSNSFGNYRDILKSVTLNPYMGDYLDLAESNKSQPNENYARELMQQFSVGTILLNPDGTPQTDSSGTPISTYSNSDVKEIARALTGWTWSRLNNAPLTDYNNRDWSKPMIADAVRFDSGAKTFLGKTVPAGTTQQANVDAVVDAVFNHPNIGPYICKRLIQQLTVSNPTPAYVERVAAAFADNGSGVRGDMKAVVRAIYLDSEARTVSQLPGKVKEPVLLATSLARAIGFTTDGFVFATRDSAMGQT